MVLHSRHSPYDWGLHMDTTVLADEIRQLILTDLVPLDDDELTNQTPLVDTVLD